MKFKLLLFLSLFLQSQKIFTADEPETRSVTVIACISTQVKVQRLNTIRELVTKADICECKNVIFYNNNGDSRKLNLDETIEQAGLWDDPGAFIELTPMTKNLKVLGLVGNLLCEYPITQLTTGIGIKCEIGKLIDKSIYKFKLISANQQLIDDKYRLVKNIPGLWENPVVHIIIQQ